MRNKIILAVIFFSLLWMGLAWADAPGLINFQGRLTDSLGNVVSDGAYSLRFRIYDDSSAGNVLWQESSSVQVSKGLFTVLLGSTSAIPESAFYSANRWLGIKVGSNPEITPRQRLASVGYSFQSGQWNSSGNNIYRDTGNVGIGTSTPTAKLDVNGTLLVNPSNSFVGVNRSTQLTGADYFGVHAPVGGSGSYGGMYISTNTNGWPFYGYSNGSYSCWHFLDELGRWNLNVGNVNRLTVTQGGNVGIGTISPIYKLDVQTTDYAIHGLGGANFTGIVGEGYTGVAGLGGGYGIYGTSSSGTGVYGASTNSYGVYAISTNGPGVVATGGTNGVEATGGSRGVYATGSNYGVVGGGLYGVYGVATQGFQGYGVFGSAGGISGTWAGAFDRDVYVAGFLAVDGFIYKYGGGFKIDHPLDPANKYLYHSFVESPDMMNIYNGNAVTDANGDATITLPDWFGALNKDFRYQLTAIGQFAQAIISKEIANNQFSIKTDKPNVKVSWQVTGIRQDAYANTHRIAVEVEKTGKEKGKYLHPEEYGAPASLGMHYEEEQKLAAEHKQMEEQRAKMEAERKQMEQQKVKMEQEGLSPKK